MSIPDDVSELFARFGGDSSAYQDFSSRSGRPLPPPPSKPRPAPAPAPAAASRTEPALPASAPAQADPLLPPPSSPARSSYRDQPLDRLFQQLLQVPRPSAAGAGSSPLGQLRQPRAG